MGNKTIERKIMFRLDPTTNRISADCGDLVNWLLDRDEKIALEFEEKYKKTYENLKALNKK